MNANIRKAAWNVFAAVVMICALTALSLTMFWMGRLAEALNPANHIEKMMCVSQSVDVRESPTGYIVARAPKGSALWFFRLDLPFAHVAYFDGHSWHEGTVSASVLEVCK